MGHLELFPSYTRRKLLLFADIIWGENNALWMNLIISTNREQYSGKCLSIICAISFSLASILVGSEHGSPWCVRTCWLRMAFWRKCLPHSGQAYGFSPLWIRRCWFNIALCLKVRSQYTQAYGFSLAWIRRCWVRWDCWRNRFPHSGQPYGRLSVCIRSCWRRVDFCLKSLPHVRHLKRRSSDPATII